VGTRDDADRCVASKVTSPHRASVDVSTNSVTTCKPVHAAAETFQPNARRHRFLTRGIVALRILEAA
jgi:hypothetical protein